MKQSEIYDQLLLAHLMANIDKGDTREQEREQLEKAQDYALFMSYRIVTREAALHRCDTEMALRAALYPMEWVNTPVGSPKKRFPVATAQAPCGCTMLRNIPGEFVYNTSACCFGTGVGQ
jgi:hypothetical protein